MNSFPSHTILFTCTPRVSASTVSDGEGRLGQRQVQTLQLLYGKELRDTITIAVTVTKKGGSGAGVLMGAGRGSTYSSPKNLAALTTPSAAPALPVACPLMILLGEQIKSTMGSWSRKRLPMPSMIC